MMSDQISIFIVTKIEKYFLGVKFGNVKIRKLDNVIIR